MPDNAGIARAACAQLTMSACWSNLMTWLTSGRYLWTLRTFRPEALIKQKRGKSNCQVSFCDFAAETLLVAVLCVTVCGLVADVAHVRAGSLFVPPAVVPSQMISNTCSMFVYQARC